MTVANDVRSVTFPGSDGFPDPKDFACTFKIFADADVVVTLRIDATGVETVQTLVTHYTVSGEGSDTGFTVTMLTAPNTGETLLVDRVLAETQTLNLRTSGNFPPDSIEDALDRGVMLTQQAIDANFAASIVSSLPTATATLVGHYRVLDGGAGVDDKLYVCLETTTDSVYAWILVSFGGA